jgi:hypothetical protein
VVRLFLDNSILPQAGRSSVKLSLIGNGTAPRIILYVYGISTRGLPGVAVNDVLGTTWRYAWQQEVAIPGGIPWENVRSYYPSPVWKSP